VPLSESQRRQRGSLAGNIGWANTEDRTARTQPGRDAFRRQFEDKIDPERKLPPEELAKRVENLRKAHYQRLAFLSSKARSARAGKAGTTGATVVRKRSTAPPTEDDGRLRLHKAEG
jgi:hypothetical protein